MSQWTDLFGLVVDVGSHLAQDHLMTDLRIGQFCSLLGHDLPHHSSNRVLLGALDPTVAKGYNVDSGQILVDRVGGEYPIDSRATSSHKAPQVVG